jgi:hypothetical protein
MPGACQKMWGGPAPGSPTWLSRVPDLRASQYWDKITELNQQFL